jgi:hypothetical protein
MMTSTLVDRIGLILFYKGQLSKFYKLGIGSKTENGVVITQCLIDVTTRRLKQLQQAKGEYTNGIRHQYNAN